MKKQTNEFNLNLSMNNISFLKQQKRQKKLNTVHNRFLSSRHLKQTQAQIDHRQTQNLNIKQALFNLEKSLDKQLQPPSSKQQQLMTLKNINHEQEKIDYQGHCEQKSYDRIWNAFLFKRQKIRNNKLKELSKITVLSQEDKQKKVINQVEALCEIMFQEITSKISHKEGLIRQLAEKIKQKYIASHQYYKNYLQLKGKLIELQKQIRLFFKQQKQNERERNQALMDKRMDKVSKKQYEYLNLNLNDQGVKQVIQKKAKLNLELDLSFQIQQRKILNQKKKQFQAKKDNLNILINEEKKKIENTKSKINSLQKQLNFIQTERQEFEEQRKTLLKQLLKNPNYRSDGLVWTIQKMLEINYKPQLKDLSEELDAEAKQYIIKGYNKLKKQFKPPQKLLFKQLNKQKDRFKHPTNRTRVKSMIISGNSKISDQPQKFFKFQFKNNLAIQTTLFTKKNTYHEGLHESHADLFNSHDFTKSNQQNQLQKQKINSFKDITKKKHVKQVYDGAKFFINKWIKNQGWKSASARKFQPSQKNAINQEFIDKQKVRIKQKYHRIGGTNRKYEVIVKTLFGDKQLDTSRRAKTSRN